MACKDAGQRVETFPGFFAIGIIVAACVGGELFQCAHWRSP